MTIADSVAIATSSLPPEKQREVLDFVEFLAQRTAGSTQVPAPSMDSVKQALASAAGIWKDRADLPEDSAQAAQVLRERATRREHP
jgi:hypothetical protein